MSNEEEKDSINVQLNPKEEDPENLETLVPDQTTETFCEKFKRKFGRIPKTVGACVIMLILGIVFIVIASVSKSLSKSGVIGMYIVGSLLLIPSVYVAYILFHVFNDTPGFRIDGIPLWDD